MLHEVRNLQGARYEICHKRSRRQVPFSLVLGAKRRGHRVREYEKMRKDVMPIDDEIIIWVDSHGPSYFTEKKVKKTNKETLRRHVRVGGEPGGSLLGSSYERLNADAMMTLNGRICCCLCGGRGHCVVEGTRSTTPVVKHAIVTVNPSELSGNPARAPRIHGCQLPLHRNQ